MAGVAANPPSPEGWQQAKPLIEQLYVQQDRPLKEVRAYLAEHRSFMATERMFKQRLKEWGFDRKKVKAAEWRYMLRVTRQRRHQGKESAFRVNGKIIVWSNIRKHLKRKKKTEDEFLSAGLDAETVEDVLCYTPPGSPHLSVPHPVTPPTVVVAHQTTCAPPQPSSERQTGCSSMSASSLEFEPAGGAKAHGSSPFTHSMPSRCSIAALTLNSDPDQIPSSSSPVECFALAATEIQNNLLLPINSKNRLPLDKATGFKISLIISGLYYQSNPAPPSERLLAQLDAGSRTNRADLKPDIRLPRTPPHGHAVLPFYGGREPSDDDLASRWVVFYFLACICECQGDRKGMEQGMEQASQVFRSMLKHFNPHLLTGLTLMASILYFHGQVELLKKFLQESCDIIEELFSSDHPIFVPYRYMLACVRRGELDTVVMSEALQRAWQQFQLTWRSVHPNTLTTRYYYGCSLLDKGNLAKAEEELRGCFDLSNRAIGDCHILTVWSLATLSRVLSSSGQGRELEALDCLETAIERCRKVMHDEHPYFLELHRYLADLHRKLNHLGQAESLYRLVLNGRIKVLGLGQEATRAALNDLCDVVTAKGRVHEADELRARYLEHGVP